MNLLPASRLHYEFIIDSRIYYEFTIFFRELTMNLLAVLWIHYKFSRSFPYILWIHYLLREFAMNSLCFSRIYFEFTWYIAIRYEFTCYFTVHYEYTLFCRIIIFFVNLSWIHYLYRGFSKNSIGVSRIHCEFTI